MGHPREFGFRMGRPRAYPGRCVSQLVHFMGRPMNERPKRLPARFYRSDSGREPVREWLKSLPREDRRIIGEDIKDVEFSWPIGMPLVRSLGRGLWEVRSSLPHGRIARLIFCVDEDRMVLLHGFMKKSQKTPKLDIDLALKRRGVENG
jgi:phage-related protein